MAIWLSVEEGKGSDGSLSQVTSDLIDDDRGLLRFDVLALIVKSMFSMRGSRRLRRSLIASHCSVGTIVLICKNHPSLSNIEC